MPTHSRATTESSHFFQEASLLDEREILDVDAARNENEIMRKINQRWLNKLEREMGKAYRGSPARAEMVF